MGRPQRGPAPKLTVLIEAVDARSDEAQSLVASYVAPDATVPAPLAGLGCSLAGMVAGSLVPQPLQQAQHHGARR